MKNLFFITMTAIAVFLINACSPLVYSEATVKELLNSTPENSMSSITNHDATGVFWLKSDAVSDSINVWIWNDHFDYFKSQNFYCGDAFIEFSHRFLELESNQEYNLRIDYLVRYKIDSLRINKIGQKSYLTKFKTSKNLFAPTSSLRFHKQGFFYNKSSGFIFIVN